MGGALGVAVVWASVAGAKNEERVPRAGGLG
jgi:hypothetical protein